MLADGARVVGWAVLIEVEEHRHSPRAASWAEALVLSHGDRSYVMGKRQERRAYDAAKILLTTGGRASYSQFCRHGRGGEDMAEQPLPTRLGGKAQQARAIQTTESQLAEVENPQGGSEGWERSRTVGRWANH